MAITINEQTLQSVIGALVDPAWRDATLPMARRWLLTTDFVGDQRERLEAAVAEPPAPPGLIFL